MVSFVCALSCVHRLPGVLLCRPPYLSSLPNTRFSRAYDSFASCLEPFFLSHLQKANRPPPPSQVLFFPHFRMGHLFVVWADLRCLPVPPWQVLFFCDRAKLHLGEFPFFGQRFPAGAPIVSPFSFSPPLCSVSRVSPLPWAYVRVPAERWSFLSLVSVFFFPPLFRFK